MDKGAPDQQPRVKITNAVDSLTREHDISERTAWRWVAHFRTHGELPTRRRRCEHCGRPLPAHATSRRRYCNDRCRIRAHRQTSRRAELAPDANSYTLDEAAYQLGISPTLLRELLDDLPLSYQRDRRGHRIERDELTQMLEGRQAHPLLRAALTYDLDPAQLVRLAAHAPAELDRARRQAHALARLTRTARIAGTRRWAKAEQDLAAALQAAPDSIPKPR